MRWCAAFVFALACSDYSLESRQHTVLGADEDGDGLVTWDLPDDCETKEVDDVLLAITDACPAPQLPDLTGFDPVVEWTAGDGFSCRATPAVGDLSGDGIPEVVVNAADGLIGGTGMLGVFHGDGSGPIWVRQDANLGYASAPAIGDIDNDGIPEIVAVRKVSGGALGLNGQFAVVAWERTGDERWQSAPFANEDFDYATGIVLSDMDHDGEVEIIAGRVILRADGTVRGVGAHGRGSWGILPAPGGGLSEATIPAVVDLDLDGIEEVIVGNAMYDPDGNTLWHDPDRADGMIAVANLDDDPEGEFIASSFDTVRAMDTDGSLLWGPYNVPGANIVSNAAIADLDQDGYPEIAVAGGDTLVVIEHDGAMKWAATVQDTSGATGASIFDFEADGWPELVYIDEVQMAVYDGLTGALKFYNPDHASDTMMDYPAIADVDADGEAEILVCHANHGRALSVYGSGPEDWAAARGVWNQHAYAISNIRDNLRIPTYADPPFTTHNSWHSATTEITFVEGGEAIDLQAELLEVCDKDCNQQTVPVIGRVMNWSSIAIPAGLPVSLYGDDGGVKTLIETKRTEDAVPPAQSGPLIVFEVPTEQIRDYDRVWFYVDDQGDGTGTTEECLEQNNDWHLDGPFCSD